MSERWVSFDCFGTLVDWDGGFRAIGEDPSLATRVLPDLDDLAAVIRLVAG